MTWQWANAQHSAVRRTVNGVEECRSLMDAEVRLWLADGHRPPDPEPGSKIYQQEHLPETLRVEIIDGARYTWYRFRKKGDALPWHDHRFEHYSTLLKGRIRVQTENGIDRVLTKPVFDSEVFPKGIKHALTAEEDGSVCVQIQLGE